MIRFFITPGVQILVATFIIICSAVLLVFAILRFIPPLESFALAPTEPFWVLLLSIIALLYAGLSALPAALAYREAKEVNVNSKEANVRAEEANVQANEVTVEDDQ